jgi:hypothetical protein
MRTKFGRTAQIEISIFLDTMIRTHIKNPIIGSSKPTTGFEQKKKKDYKRKPDKRRFAPPASARDLFSDLVQRFQSTGD